MVGGMAECLHIEKSEESTTMDIMRASSSADSTHDFLTVLHFVLHFPRHIKPVDTPLARNTFVPFLI